LPAKANCHLAEARRIALQPRCRTRKITESTLRVARDLNFFRAEFHSLRLMNLVAAARQPKLLFQHQPLLHHEDFFKNRNDRHVSFFANADGAVQQLVHRNPLNFHVFFH
jgi:hypothetical protein